MCVCDRNDAAHVLDTVLEESGLHVRSDRMRCLAERCSSLKGTLQTLCASVAHRVRVLEEERARMQVIRRQLAEQEEELRRTR